MADQRRKPSSISDVVPTVLERTGITARLEQARIVDEWAALVGPQIAAAARARSITADGTLFVNVRNHAWMSELSLLEPEILRILNARTGQSRVRQIRWKLMSRDGPK